MLYSSPCTYSPGNGTSLDLMLSCFAQDLIKKHSEFISYPISLWVEKTTEKEVDDDEEESSAPKEDEEEGKIEEVLLLFNNILS